MPIADAISLSIALQSPPVSAQGFGTLLLMTEAGSLGLNTPSFYSTASAILADPASGIVDSDDVYKAAVDAFSQPNVSSIAIARVDSMTAQDTDVTIDSVDGGAENWTAAFTIQGLTYTAVYAAPGGHTTNDVATNLVSAINAIVSPGEIPVTAGTPVGATFANLADSAGFAFGLTVTSDGSGTATVAPDVVPVRPSTGASAIYAAAPSSWYGVAFPGADDAQIFDLAEWVETVRKIQPCTATGAGNKSASADSLFVKLKAQSFVRTMPIYNDSGDFAGEAWGANRLAVNPDAKATTWAFVTLPSVTIGDETTTEQTAIEGANGNYYSDLGGVGSTYPGVTPGGQSPDLITTVDWLFFRLTERYQAIFLDYSNRGSKIPFTDGGIAVFEASTIAQLQLGENIGHFVPGSSEVDVPTLAEVTPADRVARTLRFAFSTEPSGAIEKVVVTGSVSIPVA